MLNLINTWPPITRRILLFSFVSLIGLSAALYPARQANAFIFFAGEALAEAYAALTTSQQVSLAASVAIHAAIAMITFGSSNDPKNPNPAQPGLSVQIDPKTPLATPSGWTAGTASNPKPTPPSTQAAGAVTHYVGENGIEVLTLNQACPDGSIQDASPPGGATTPGSTIGSTGYTSSGCIIPGNSVYITWVVRAACPAGYTLSGSTCTLNDPTKVMKPADGSCTFIRQGNTITQDPNDPECFSLPPSVTTTPNSISVTDPSSGKTSSVNIDPNGTATVTSSAPGTDSGGNPITTTKTTQLSAPDQNGAGTGVQVMGQSSSTVQGAGTLAGQGGTSTGPSLNLPTDYNREATQQQILQKLDFSGQDTSLQTQKTNLDTEATKITTAIGQLSASDLHGFSWPWMPQFPNGQCQDLQFSYKGYSTGFNLCSTVALIKSILGWVIYIFTGVLLFQILTGSASKEAK